MAGDNVLLVRWNEHETELLRRFAAYLTDDAFVDVTLWCPDRCFKAHRVILSACSDYLERVLLDQPEGGGLEPVSVVLHGVEAEDVAALLQLMYRGQALVPARDLPRFLDCARALGVRLLQSAALRVCAAQPRVAGADGAHQEQSSEGGSQVYSHQTVDNSNQRAAPVVSAAIRPQLPQSRPSTIEDHFSVSPSQESTEQEPHSTKQQLAVAQTFSALRSHGFTPERSPQCDAAGVQVQHDRMVTTWSAAPSAALPLQQGAAAAATCHRTDPAALASQPAIAGHSAAGAPANDWLLPALQEQRCDGKSQSDRNQTSDSCSNRVASAVSTFINPAFPRKPSATTEYKFTVPKEQISLMENAGNERSNYHMASSQTLTAVPPQVFAAQSAAAAQVQMTSAWSGPAAVGLPLQQQAAAAVKQVPPQPPPQAPLLVGPACHRVDVQPAAAPASQAASTAGAPTNEWQVPQS